MQHYYNNWQVDGVEGNPEREIENVVKSNFSGNGGFGFFGSSNGYGVKDGDIKTYEQFMKGRDGGNGTFGIGGNGGDLYDKPPYPYPYNPNTGGGGGGGYYGGGAGSGYWGSRGGPGGGGSGYISASFVSGRMISGFKQMPSYKSFQYMNGISGNGAARISIIDDCVVSFKCNHNNLGFSLFSVFILMYIS
ncbi:hypothetical protein TVAG_429200 [Trichomonas vaginalis G3]|uniref:Uncharacterized protein n=1 Tax=Trichomonas vaginalis (strain ATCC PRA-98 / G3) TaxID=412133 RepID=A2F939_TRIV3|nr:glycine-rich protein family [Trichomonas vaginalis G3]EAX98567.1 hypothetical protein TVAG_429200 [Trichomonas vaginalis G3]KAI5505241.1 glycine-rich protein family [Trichomonas vaginalis G3]|eukprot:XP_001311497.1 hypothetical protein [Trichomonas vaginalis G3]